MNLTFRRNYKSIKQLPIAVLPAFTIITGENGAGKTHFLEALKEGDIRVEEVFSGDMRYYTWGSMVPTDDNGIVPRSNGTLSEALDLHRFVIKVREEAAYLASGQMGVAITTEQLVQS